MKNRNNIGYYFIMTALVLWSIFMIYPIISSLMLSMQSCQGNVCEFAPKDNIARLLSDDIFKKALFNTFLFFIIQVPVMIFLALVIASILNDSNTKFKGLFRTLIFLPAVTSLVAYSVLFKMMLAPDGIINQFLTTIGLGAIPWLTDPFWARVTIIIAITWRWTGFNMIFYLSALQNVSNEVYEAAAIDGATKKDQFFKITLPLLKPVILFTAIMSTIGTLQLFDEPMNITQGGPSNATLTLSQHIFNISFKNLSDFGYAALLSYVIVIIVAILAFIQTKAAKEED